MKELISIVVPCYNEEKALPHYYNKMREIMNNMNYVDFEIILVNDGSKDNTLKEMQELARNDARIKFINFSKNFGKEAAMYAGFEYSKGDFIAVMDADLQDPPELIPELVKHWEEGYDDVYARRRKRTGEGFVKKFTSKMYYKVLQKMTNVEIQKDTGNYRLIDRRCINALKKMTESERCLKSMFSWIGYNKKEVLFDRPPRVAGKTKWNYIKLMDLAINGITSFTTSPLRLAIWVAIPTFMMLIIYAGYVIAKCFVTHTMVQAFQAIILLILFFSGIQILLFGIVGEYLGRIFKETKNRPLYFVNEHNGKKEMNENK